MSISAFAVGERVEERETDCVRFGAGADRAGDPVLGFGEAGVCVPPQAAGVPRSRRSSPASTGVLRGFAARQSVQRPVPSERLGSRRPRVAAWCAGRR